MILHILEYNVPCSMLLLFAGSWGSCLPLRPDEGVPVGGEGLPWGCALTDRNIKTQGEREGDIKKNVLYCVIVVAFFPLWQRGLYQCSTVFNTNWSEAQNWITETINWWPVLKVKGHVRIGRGHNHEGAGEVKEVELSVFTGSMHSISVFLYIPVTVL